jgi:hypothetical protein
MKTGVSYCQSAPYAGGSSRRQEARYFVAAVGSDQLEPANEQGSKRHRAAALHDAGANTSMSLLPRGRGVRQPYAAFAAAVHAHCSVPSLLAAPLGSCDSTYVGCYGYLAFLSK